MNPTDLLRPPPSPSCRQNIDVHYHHNLSFPPSTTPQTSHRKKRIKNLLLDRHPAANKTDTTAPKITGPCTECGKKFWSSKALYGHMRCHPERQWRGINPPPHLRRSSPVPVTGEDYDGAESLLFLALGGTGDPKFKCSSCKKTFGSHQALRGHRASHKNVKGCFAINNDPVMMIMEAQNNDNDNDNDMDLGMSLGLGLGLGHMRWHWDQPCSSSIGPGMGPNSGAQYGPSSCSSEVQLDLRLGL